MSRFTVCLAVLMWLQPAVAETLRVTDLDFDRVLLHGSSQLEIRQGETVELIVRGRSHSLEKNPFFLDGDILVLGRDRHSRLGADKLKYRLTVVNLRHLQLNGAGDIYVKPLEVGDFTISLEGSGEMKLYSVKGRNVTVRMKGSGDIRLAELRAEELQVILSGSGDINLGEMTARDAEFSLNGSGDIGVRNGSTVDKLEVNIVGSGDIEVDRLEAQAVAVHIMGSGSASVHARSKLIVNTVGSGDVEYRGDPEVDRTVLGSGDVQRKR